METNKRVLKSVYYLVITFFSLPIIAYIATSELFINSLINTINGWTILLFYFAGFCKSVADTCSDHFSKSIFKNKYWDKSSSWINKYVIVDGMVTNERKKIFWIIPRPVLLSDGWHLFQSLMIWSMVIGVCFYSPYFNFIIDIIIIRVAFGCGFYGFYNWYLINPKYRC